MALAVLSWVLLAASACAPAAPDAAAAAVSGFATTGHYTSKTPYAPPPDSVLPPVPEGFRPLMVQLVARHGSRALSSPDDDDLSLQVWRQAQAEGALTPLGEALGPVLEDIRAVHAELGYGAISARGGREQRELATRLMRRQAALFEDAVASGRRVRVLHSGRDRTDQSAVAFIQGLERAFPAVAALIDPPQAEPEVVYFNDVAQTPAAVAYRRYRQEDARLAATLQRLHQLPQTRLMARRLLGALYAPSFVDRLEAGDHHFAAAADPGDVISDAVDAAASLYALYSISTNMDLDADWNFGRFIEPAAATWFAMIDDAESFYERGPGFAGDDVTWRAADVLLEDFIAGIEAVAAGVRSDVAVLRFTHAQALIPFAARLGIDGAHQGLPEDIAYSYETSSWRSALVSPMAANIQWDAYVDGQDNVLVRMLHHERAVRFAATCRSWPDTEYFYALDEIKRCYR